MIRKACTEDIDRITEIYMAIHEEEEKGRLAIGWDRNTYPVRQTAVDGVGRGDMFVVEDEGVVVASGMINHVQGADYNKCQWKYDAPDQNIMVLHTLAVDPAIRSKGYGTEFINFYEQYALEQGCPYLRMDTQEKNESARKFYKNRGYQEPGIISCIFNGIPNTRMVCLEKKLPCIEWKEKV